MGPNLSVVVGSVISAKLIALTGGLMNLSKVPACNIQGLGAKQKNLLGFSPSMKHPHRGLIFNSDIIQQTPTGYRAKALKLVSAKCAWLVKIDSFGQDPSGNIGSNFRRE